jgi:hypothetical protein
MVEVRANLRLVFKFLYSLLCQAVLAVVCTSASLHVQQNVGGRTPAWKQREFFQHEEWAIFQASTALCVIFGCV